jgi:CheY-like chemotaxis protein
MVDLLRRTIGESIEIKVVEDEELWKCFVDPNQLENAILNLAINARDAMSTGGTLEVMTSNRRIDDDYARARSDAAPGEYVLITVGDTGSGMTEEVQQHAFEPFYTTKDVGQGSGLGLSMVYGFIKQSGGHVNAYSEMGAGTTVSLFLPRYSEEEVPEGASNDPAEIPKANGEVVLVVEDDSDLRSLMVRILRSLNYRVLNANSGVSALEILNSPTKVDLLFTDLVLPERMAGTVLAEKARRVRPDLRVLYMSGYSDDSIIQHERNGDSAPFLRKPFRTVDVALRVREALAMSQKLG